MKIIGTALDEELENPLHKDKPGFGLGPRAFDRLSEVYIIEEDDGRKGRIDTTVTLMSYPPKYEIQYDDGTTSSIDQSIFNSMVKRGDSIDADKPFSNDRPFPKIDAILQGMLDAEKSTAETPLALQEADIAELQKRLKDAPKEVQEAAAKLAAYNKDGIQREETVAAREKMELIEKYLDEQIVKENDPAKRTDLLEATKRNERIQENFETQLAAAEKSKPAILPERKLTPKLTDDELIAEALKLLKKHTREENSGRITLLSQLKSDREKDFDAILAASSAKQIDFANLGEFSPGSPGGKRGGAKLEV